MQGIALRVKGKVQGVGFRPFVWQLAHELGLPGEVLNDGQGVLIRLPNDERNAAFIDRLQAELPPLAQITSVESQPIIWQAVPGEFRIVQSQVTAMDTQVVPDAATCPDCLNELHASDDRRHHYPFINCTHCGPRFTIINQLPYDRPKTVMREFPLCPTCSEEYKNPADRRYHAQPVACAECGPQVWLSAPSGERLEGNWLERVVNALHKGKVIAIKSVGGFHLACDATNPDAVATLRQRKHRQFKPFAIMLADSKQAEQYANCVDDERTMLESRQAPIVLLKKKPNDTLAASLAPGLCELGVMLPSNPIQHLVATAFGKPVVMTSGNATGLPPALNNHEALKDLSADADLFVLHDRDIVQRCDDSLVRLTPGQKETLRRSRGFVPDAVNLPDDFPAAEGYLAYGGDLKNAFAIGKGRQIIVSQYLGDLSNRQTQKQYEDAIAHLTQLYQVEPDKHVVDMHPGYYSHQYALKQPGELCQVQHHHAHIAACLMENNWPLNGNKVLALALDGIGLGDDGQFWGAELMVADYQGYQRLGGMQAVPLVAADKAAKQPWRSLHAHLKHNNLLDGSIAERYFSDKPTALIDRAIAQNINCNLVRSAGRLFDAVAASLGIFSDGIEYEGQAACHLQALAEQYNAPQLTDYLDIALHNYELDMHSFWCHWLAQQQGSVEYKAWLFHNTLAKALAQLVLKAKQDCQLTHLVLTGGVFHNSLLRELLTTHLGHQITLLQHQDFSCGDGSLSLGQLAVALANQSRSEESKPL